MVAGVLAILAPAAYAERTGDNETAVAAPVDVQRLPGGLRDEVAMVIVGSALIGLAAAVRKAA